MTNVADAGGIGDGDAGASGKGRGRRRLIVIAGGAALALAAAGGGYFLLAGSQEGEEAAQVEQKPALFIDLPQMTVNLNTPSDRPGYLRVTVALEVADERLVEQVQTMLPRVMDTFQTHLRELRPADLEGSAGLYRLREELLRRINQAVYPAKVDAILFKELLLQ